MHPVLSTCRSCLLLLRHGMLKSRLCKGWWLIRLCRILVGRYPMKHRVISDSRELSCKLLVYCMELGKSVLKLWRELPVRRNIPMNIARCMNVMVSWWRCWSITLGSWSLRRMSGLISLIWVLWSVGSTRATMCMLRWGSLLVLA